MNCIKLLDETLRDFKHYRLNAVSDEHKITWDLIVTKLEVLRNKFFRELEEIREEERQRFAIQKEKVIMTGCPDEMEDVFQELPVTNCPLNSEVKDGK